MKTISICIPTYEMKGLGTTFLRQSFDILARQTYTDFEVVISDHSQNNDIEDLCTTYKDRLDIQYYRNTQHRGNSSANTNAAITRATGKLLKILFQDDFLYNETSLETIVSHFDIEKDHWLVSACTHTNDGTHFYRDFFPRYTTSIHLGDNTISSPSVLTIKNDSPLLFDETLIWLMDVEYYKRLYDSFGSPIILDIVTVVNRTGSHQVSHTIATTELQKKEFLSVLKTYEHGCRFWYYKIRYEIKIFIKTLLRKI